MTNSRTALTALTTAALLALTACGSGVDPDPTEPPPAGPSESASAPTADDGRLGEVLAAIDRAVEETSGAAYDVDELDQDGAWEIDVASGKKSIEVEISPSGDVTEHATDDLTAAVTEGIERAEIMVGPAIETALQEVDGTFHDAELREIEGEHYWQVSIDTAQTEQEDDDHQVLVDVTDGEVIVTE